MWNGRNKDSYINCKNKITFLTIYKNIPNTLFKYTVNKIV